MNSILLIFLAVVMLTGCGNAERYKDKLLLRVNDVLYVGEIKEELKGPMGDSGCIGGQIESSIEEGKIPKVNNRSNFGEVGNSYTFDDGDGYIQVLIGDEWYLFERIYD